MNGVLEKAYLACEGCRQSTVTQEARDSFVEARKSVETLTDGEGPLSGTLIPAVGQHL